MLIGLGEPFMDPKIFERIEYCERHNTSTLLSTNGTFLDEAGQRLTAAPLDWGLTATFRDVPQSNGNYRYVETAYANGILSGYTDGTFRPNALMTRAQVCGVLYQFVVDADQN